MVFHCMMLLRVKWKVIAGFYIVSPNCWMQKSSGVTKTNFLAETRLTLRNVIKHWDSRQIAYFILVMPKLHLNIIESLCTLHIGESSFNHDDALSSENLSLAVRTTLSKFYHSRIKNLGLDWYTYQANSISLTNHDYFAINYLYIENIILFCPFY